MSYERDHVTYVVEFESERVKIGVTKQWWVRLATYVREAERQGGKVVAFQISRPLSKRVALELERRTKRRYALFAAPGHSETFVGVPSIKLCASMLAAGISPTQRIAHFCGKYNARTAGQRAAILVDVCTNDPVAAIGIRA